MVGIYRRTVRGATGLDKESARQNLVASARYPGTPPLAGPQRVRRLNAIVAHPLSLSSLPLLVNSSLDLRLGVRVRARAGLGVLVQGSAQGGEIDVLKFHLGCLLWGPHRESMNTQKSVLSVLSILGANHQYL